MTGRKISWSIAVMLAAMVCSAAQAQTAPATTPQVTTQAVPADAAQGGAIKGTVIAGTVGKPGVPLPGVAVTAKNSLTGKQYTTTTDIDGNYAMTIPKNGRYVIRVELAGFAAETHEVVLNGGTTASAKDADFGMELASRAAAAAAAQTQTQQTAAATTLQRGVQGLSLNADTTNADDATAAGATNANTGAALPSLASLNTGASENADAAADSVAVSGQSGQMNGLAGVSEEDMRNRINDAIANGRANGTIPEGVDVNNIIAGVLGGMMGGPGGQGGPGGPGGGRGGRGAGGPGGGNFRNFNPAQPHGSIYYTGGNSALNSSSWNITEGSLPHFKPNPSAYSNRFGASIAGSPYIPGLTKPNTKQFVFINMNGQKNLNAFSQTGTVPTSAERAGNFAGATYGPTTAPITLYDPVTGNPIPGNNLANASVPISPVAKTILANYYPLCNVSPTCDTTFPTYNNYQTITNAGNNSVTLNTRYMRQIGGSAPGNGFRFNGAGQQRGQRGQNNNQPPALRQNLNLTYNFSHSAQDNRNIFLPLGGASETSGNSLNVGYVLSYGRFSNNASVNWNRSNAETRNYFTDTSTNPNTVAGLNVPTQTGSLPDGRFYNGLASFSFGVFTGIGNTTPSLTINQTVSYSDFIAYRHKNHNWRIGFDIRRVHADSIGGNNPLGRYTFSGYATASPASQVAGTAGTTFGSGNGFADFLLGLPESTGIQAGLYKDYLRENVYDGYVTDDWRLRGNLTLNYGMRYEYFGPYTEKNGRLVNLTGISSGGYGQIGCVTPFGNTYAAGTGPITCAASNSLQSLVSPDKNMFAPRFGFAYRPKAKWKAFSDWVIRGGYGVNYNTGQYATFARLLSHQEPFSVTQTNDFPLYSVNSATAPSATGCTTTQSAYTYTNSFGQTVTRPATTANMSLGAANSGFNCSTQLGLTNNWAVDPHYRLGMLQIYNLNLQRVLPLQMVLNIGYNGAKDSNLDVVGSPNASPSGVSTPGIAPFDFEEALASAHSNQLVVSLQKRQQKGIALGVTYTYMHAIDNASGVGGAVGTPIQNFYNLAAEEGNSSFDQRHNLTGNWLLELPFGPNRAFLNKGGVMSRILDGWNFSGTFTFASGNYFTPQYSGSEAEAASGNTFTQRPDRVFTQRIKGAGSLLQWFNPNAFTAPAGTYGTASQGSIEGPGTVSVNSSLSRTYQFGGTNSLEARVTANNVFNTVQYSGISTTQNSSTFGEVTSAAAMRSLTVLMRYRF